MDVREIEDIGDSALSYNEVKALSTGNPLLLDKAQADADLTRLERLERSHAQGRSRLRQLAASHEQKIPQLQAQLAALDTALAHRRDTRGDRFAMTVAGRRFTSRPEAGEHLRAQLLDTLQSLGDRHDLPGLVELGGLRFDARVVRTLAAHGYHLQIPTLPRTDVNGSGAELEAATPTSLVIRLENRLADLHTVREQIAADLATSRAEITNAAEQAAKPFAHADALAAARQRVADLEAELTALAAPSPEPGEPTEPGLPSEPGKTPAPATGPTFRPGGGADTVLAPMNAGSPATPPTAGAPGTAPAPAIGPTPPVAPAGAGGPTTPTAAPVLSLIHI